MKGTLYSADFIKTSDGDIKLLELNTDTAFVDSALNNFNYSEFIEILSGSLITEVHVIYKDYQESFINHLSESLNVSASFITTFNKTEEHTATIYPTDVTDSDEKFILRCAYNESAIFDSEYCKTNTNLYQLFYENTGSTDVPGFYYSSSEDDVVINTIEDNINSTSVPDFAIKNNEVTDGSNLNFFKVGRTDLPDSTRISNFIVGNKSDNTMITNYYDTSGGSNTMKSIRVANILHGTDLHNITLYEYQVDSLLEKPSEITWDTASLTNAIDKKHYFEFATNYFKIDWRNLEGIYQNELLTEASGSSLFVKDAVIGNNYQSLKVAGAPDESDTIESWKEWFATGSNLPEGTEVTSSQLIYKESSSVTFNVLTELNFNDNTGSLLAGPALPLLVYNTEEDKISYEEIRKLKPTTHQLFNSTGSLVDIDRNDYVILESTDEWTYKLDFESDDTFLINEAGVKIVSHNLYYCFAENTKIMMSDGSTKNIQDIKVGDLVSSYDTITNEFIEEAEVTEVSTSTLGDYESACKDLGYDECGLFSINRSDIKFAPTHPFMTKRGWAALTPAKGQEPFLTEQSDVLILERGDEILQDDGTYVVLDEIVFIPADKDTKLYNFSVEGTKTYIANGFIVHNK